MMINEPTLTSLLEKCAGKPDSGINFIYSNTTVFLSYNELFIHARSVLAFLNSRGIVAGDELIIQTEDNKDLLTVFWACVLGGIIAIPVSGGGQQENLRKPLYIRELLRNPWIICDPGQYGRLKEQAEDGLADMLFLETKWVDISNIMSVEEQPVLADISPEDIAYIQYSSGSTGQPKGVTLTHSNLVHNIADIADRTMVSGDDRLLSWMPLTHDMGLICFHLTGIYAGANEYLIGTPVFIRRPLLWMESAHIHQATVLYSPNFGLQYFLSALEHHADAHHWDLSAVRLIYNGAEMIAPALCEAFAEKMKDYRMPGNVICPGYGLAEASVAVTLSVPGDPIETGYFERDSLHIGMKAVLRPDAGHPDTIVLVTVGAPVSQCAVRIVNSGDKVLPDGYVGHIQIKGHNVTQGYYRDTVNTAALFTKDGWLRTGDLGLLTDGKLVISGRFKNMLVIQGKNYYPHDIERICMTGLGMTTGKVVACGFRDEKAGHDQLLVFVLFKGNKTTFAPIGQKINNIIPAELGIPVYAVVPIPQIPKTTSGKIQHFKLVAAYASGMYEAWVPEEPMFDATGGKLDRPLFDRLYEAVTGCSPYAPSFPFLSSLQAVQIISRVKQVAGIYPAIDKIFEYQHPDELYNYLQQLAPSEDDPIVPVVSTEYHPLSQSQHRIWMLAQLDEKGNAFNLNAAYQLRGMIDENSLIAAFDQLVTRHEALRTGFKQLNGIPAQFILPRTGHIVQLAAYDVQEQANEIDIREELIAAFGSQPFDLEKDVLIRVRLVTLAADEHLLLISIHHIIMDGWSFGVLMKELGQYYRGGGQAFLPALPFQYKDYCKWHEQHIESGSWTGQESYWRRELLAGYASVGRALSGKTNAAGDFSGGIAACRFEPALQQGILDLCGAHRCTPFTVLLSVLYTLLYKYTGKQEMMLGVAHAGRGRHDLGNQIGCYMKLLPIGISLQDNTTFISLLGGVTHGVREALANQDYPVERLWRSLKLAGNTELPELFDILALYQEFEETAVLEELDGSLEVTSLPVPVHSSVAGLQIEWWMERGVLHSRINYNTGLFDASFIHHLQERFMLLAARLIEAPDMAIGDVDLLDETERQRLLYPSREDSAVVPLVTDVFTAFAKQAARRGAAIAVTCGSENISYDRLMMHASYLANLLETAHNIEKGDAVGVLLPRGTMQLTAILAIWKLGAVLVAMDDSLPEERIAAICADSALKVVVTDQVMASMIRPLYDTCLPGPFPDSWDDNKKIECHPPDTAYLLYTSGTTGKPKGVMVTHGSLVDYIHTFCDYFKIADTDVVVQQSSLLFDTAFEEILSALYSGARLVIAPAGNHHIPALVQLMEEEKVTVLSATPLVLDAVNEYAERLLTLRCVISGGDLLKWPNIDRFMEICQVYNTYGPTETTICVCFHRVLGRGDVSFIGRPVANHMIYLLDEALHPVMPGATGEICIAGAGVAVGYKGLPVLTAAAFVANPYALPGYDRLYKTGDIGRWQPDGTLAFLGRKDNQVKIRGYRIEPEEVARVLEMHPDIVQAYCRVWKAHTAEACLIAYYTVAASGPSLQLNHFLEKRLPYYMIPSYFMEIPLFPINRNGKIDAAALPWPVSGNGALDLQHGIAANAVEKALMRLWEEVLEKQEINLWDHFFEAGGNSLSATRLIGLVHQKMNRKLTLRDVFVYPTVRLMAERIYALPLTVYDHIPVAGQQPYYALSGLQHNLWALCQEEQASVAYNETEVLQLDGDLSVPTLVKAFVLLAERHEILRTAFVTIEGQPVQQIQPTGSITEIFREADLRGQDHIAERVDEIIRDEAYRPFRLEIAPLLRLKLVRTDHERYILIITVHHLISDGWSVGVFVREMSLLYNILWDGGTPALPSLPIQYKDFSTWHAAAVLGGEMADCRNYWINKLDGFNALVALPFVSNISGRKSYWGRRAHFTVDQATGEALKAACIRYGSGSLPLVLAVVKALFYRYTGQEDITIGTPVSGRERPELEGQIGLYVNTLALRTNISADMSFETLLRQEQETFAEAIFHQSYPQHLLADEVKGTFFNGSGLYNIMVVMENRETEAIATDALSGLRTARYTRAAEKSRFDLVFFYEEGREQWYFDIEYDTDIFSEQHITALFSHFRTLMESALLHPEKKLQELALLPAAEQEVLDSFNNTQTPEIPDITLTKLFEQQVRQSPNAVALREGEKNYTFRELNSRANRIAHLLLSRQLSQPGGLVALLLDRSFEMIAGIWGILKAGAAYVPIDPAYPRERMRYVLQDTSATAVLTTASCFDKVEQLQWECPALKGVVCLDDMPDVSIVSDAGEAAQVWDYTAEDAADEVAASGWKDSRTGDFFTAEDMKEAVDNILGKIRPCMPAGACILEVGCGSGLLTYELAPDAAIYYATDISVKVLDRCRERMQGRGWEHVSFRQLDALAIHTLAPEKFDVIIVNSVLQYFPSYRYARNFLEQALRLLKPGGVVFLGDIRSREEQQAYYHWRFEGEEDIDGKVQQAWRTEEELFFPSAFFADFLANLFPQMEAVPSRKEGVRVNELTLFRFDVLLRAKGAMPAGIATSTGRQVFSAADVYRCPETDPQVSVSGDALAYVIYTSGSTGQPKGAMLAHKGVVNRIAWMWDAYGFSAADVVLQKTTYVFDVSVWEIFLPSCWGCTMVLCPPQGGGDPYVIMECVERYGITILHFVPSVLQVFLQTAEPSHLRQLKTLRGVFASGEALSAETAALFYAKIPALLYNLYGPTEASVDVTAYTVRPGDKAIPIGKPISNVKMFVLDQHLQRLPIGIKGEICISGIALAKGYLNQPVYTRERFVPNPHADEEGCQTLYKTGDIGYWDQDGNLMYVGRQDNQVKLRGFRIEPGEIENVLRKYRGVEEAVVMLINGGDEDAFLGTTILLNKDVLPVAAAIADVTAQHPEMNSALVCLPNNLSVFQQNRDETAFLYKEMFEEHAYFKHGVHIKQHDVVFDVGANIGMFSLFAGLAAENVTVYAFEPITSLFDLLQANTSLYNLQARLFPVALGSEEKMEVFTYYPNNSLMSGRFASFDSDATLLENMMADVAVDETSREAIIREKMQMEQQRCQIRRLSDIIRENNIARIDLLKVDVEKSEWDVLCSIESHDWPKIRQVVMEVEDLNGEAQQVVTLLRQYGFLVTCERQEAFTATSVFNIYATREKDNTPAVTMPATSYTDLRWWGLPQLEKALKTYCGQLLPAYMIPSRFLWLTAMPLTSNGKFDRGVLRKKLGAVSNAVHTGSGQPQGDTEKLLAQIWMEVLGITTVERDSNFFEIGGHSLKAAKVMFAINKQLQVNISLGKIFRFNTLRVLAKAIDRLQQMEAHPVVPVPPQAYYKMSDAQLRFWMMHQQEDNRVADNMPGAVLLEGTLARDHMFQAFKNLITRHESLRTTFITVNGEPFQKIHEAADWPFELLYKDLSTNSAPAEEARDIVRLEAAFHFDLEQGPLVRVLLLMIAPQQHVLVFNMHHIVADGHSMEVLLNDLILYYNTRLNENIRLPDPLPFQYKDYLAWQEQHAKQDTNAAGQFWLSYLKKPLPRLDLRKGADRPAILPSHGNLVTGELGETLYRQLLLRSRETGASLYVITSAAVNILLSAISGASDIIVGSPVDNREHFELEKQIGNFLNILPVRTRLTRDMSFKTLVMQFSATMVQLMEYRYYPFNRIVQDLDIPRDLSRNILFDVGFTFNYSNNLSFSGDGPTFEGLKASIFENGYRSVKSDIWINCTESVRNLKIVLEYNTALYHHEFAMVMLKMFRTLLQSALQDTGATVQQLQEELLGLLRVYEEERLLAKRSTKTAGLKTVK